MSLAAGVQFAAWLVPNEVSRKAKIKSQKTGKIRAVFLICASVRIELSMPLFLLVLYFFLRHYTLKRVKREDRSDGAEIHYFSLITTIPCQSTGRGFFISSIQCR